MKKVVLTFGLISGVMISVLMGGSLLLAHRIGSGHSMVLGYTIMVASFLLIYFGIRSYRDNTLGGRISFGRAFACGILIALITCVCYVAHVGDPLLPVHAPLHGQLLRRADPLHPVLRP